MILVHVTTSFTKKVAKLGRKYPQLPVQLTKQLKLFTQNPTHSGLRVHKLKGKRSEQYAVWIFADLRALAMKNSNTYIFFDLVTHDEY